MKSFSVLIAALLAFTMPLSSQIPNGSFENWSSGEPDQWTTIQTIFDNPAIPISLTLVAEDTAAYHGSSSIKESTDQTSFQNQQVTIPGVATNGGFVDIGFSNGTDVLNDLQNGNIRSIIKGGDSFTKRPGKLNGYYTFSSSVDTFLVYLRLTRYNSSTNTQQIIAEETYELGGQTSSFKKFSLDLNYQSCLNPDSMLIAFASANGANGTPGTDLQMDSLNFSGSGPELKALDDVDSTNENQDVIIPVGQNDKDCQSDNATINIIDGPQNGNASTSNDSITYTPDSDWSGRDTITYETCVENSAKCDTAQSKITVKEGVKVKNVPSTSDELHIKMYPVPVTGDEVNLSVDKEVVGSKLSVFNLLGKKMDKTKIQSTQITIDVTNFRKGIYLYHITDQQGNLLRRERFNVVR